MFGIFGCENGIDLGCGRRRESVERLAGLAGPTTRMTVAAVSEMTEIRYGHGTGLSFTVPVGASTVSAETSPARTEGA